MDVRARIRRFFDEAITERVRDEDDVFSLGAVNSLFALQLVTFVETEFSITAEREDLDIDNFSSVDALTTFVVGKLGGPGAGP